MRGSGWRAQIRQPPRVAAPLAVLSVVVLVVQLGGRHATAWHFFDDAVRLLTSDRGLHLYGDHPELQFGPLSIVAAIPFAALGRDVGSWAAMAVGSAVGLVVVALLLDTVRRLRPGPVGPPAAALVAGAIVVVTWSDVAVRTAHIDDIIALLAIVAAVRWCAMDRAGAATAALAIAAAAKPWAIVFAPLAVVPPGRMPGARLAGIAALVALTWAPFVLADPDTFDVTRFAIDNDPTSVLRALGVDDATTPGWVRPVQLLGGTLVVAAAVAARRWPAALVLGVTWRLLLEPGAHRYYTVGIVLGSLLVELAARPGRLPWITVAAAVALEVTALPGFPGGAGGALRLICLVAVAARSLVGVAARPEAQALR